MDELLIAKSMSIDGKIIKNYFHLLQFVIDCNIHPIKRNHNIKYIE